MSSAQATLSPVQTSAAVPSGRVLFASDSSFDTPAKCYARNLSRCLGQDLAVIGEEKPALCLQHPPDVRPADLIVMEAPKRSSWLAANLSPTHSSVVSRSTCPVLLYGQKVTPKPGHVVTNVVCGIPFNHYSRALVARAVQFAKLFGARLTLIHVIPEVSEGLLVQGLCGTSRIVLDGDEARIQLARLVDSFDRGVETDFQVGVGDTQSDLLKCVRKEGADLLIIGGTQGSELALLSGLIAKSSCPVLRVPFGRFVHENQFLAFTISAPLRDAVCSSQHVRQRAPMTRLSNLGGTWLGGADLSYS